MYGEYTGKVPERRCPICGTSRPVDWFTGDDEACWKCKSYVPTMKHAPEDHSHENIRRRMSAAGAKVVNPDDLIG